MKQPVSPRPATAPRRNVAAELTSTSLWRTLVPALVAVLVTAGLAFPRAAPGQENPFGVQDRADAAQRMILLAVQQGISSLPPASAQSITYEFDPAVGTFEPSARLGPISFLSPDLVGPGRFSFRLGASYFELDESLGPIDYRVGGEFAPQADFVGRFGLDAGARVTIVSLAASYGVNEHFQLDFNLPVVVTDASGSEVVVTDNDFQTPVVVPIEPPGLLDSGLASGAFVVRRGRFTDVGVAFPSGTNVGVGRISIGAKASLYSSERLQIAFAPELLLPSPSEGELAGSESTALFPKLVGSLALGDVPRLHADIGYDNDFRNSELRRFVWNLGTSLAFSRLAVDLGFGGSEFERGIFWTPSKASFTSARGQQATLEALGDNQLGTTFVNFLGGIKLRIRDDTVIGGAFVVPMNDEGARANVMGSLALEHYFGTE